MVGLFVALFSKTSQMEVVGGGRGGLAASVALLSKTSRVKVGDHL